MSLNQYHPETVSHPGITLVEKMNELGIGPKEFAIRTGKPEKTISSIISGESSITPDMAVLFEDVILIPAHFWINRQKQYDEAHARIKRNELIALASDWSKQFPYAEMAKLGWVNPTRKLHEKVENLFRFFGVASPLAFENYYFNRKLKVSFRISLVHTKKPYAFAAWLRQGEIQASQLKPSAYNEKKLASSLPAIKNIMAKHPEDFFVQLQDICFESGLKLVYTPCLPGAQVHGSTRWIGNNPLIQMSARYKQNDIFWFTFFHEVAHILKHGKKHVSLENINYDDEDQVKEQEADDFAVYWTFSEKEEEEVFEKQSLTPKDILFYAKKFNTHPAMIIGRLHHKGIIPFSMGREFIQKIDITE
jgi:addiction module HigA family antidote